MSKKVAVIMGSANDFPKLQAAVDVLQQFDVASEVRVISAHRAPKELEAFAAGLVNNGFGCVIAAAGMAAHLPGVTAAFTPLPVIGVPISGGALKGVDALYAIVQMPKGVPVATVAIDGAANAALLAVQILAGADAALFERFVAYKARLADECLATDAALRAELDTSV
ncbi:MAG: 5-(carboxyamino)imidazole ribonucleotide mutase [Myxococcales bacterium]|jgi:5-(carboxyamino)imidazole ribonucleotide mutase|nr:5-(carboxyamino)imidazole ribonucleotide mutase [Myxococcales bacterium]